MSSSNSDEEVICPKGYICDFYNDTIVEPLRIYSCKQLQQDVIEEGYGDILAGIYCKNGTLEDGGAQISNCPSGHYCKDPDSDPIKCRAGVYCPAKSAREDLYPCRNCKEGATRYSIDILSLTILVLLTIVLPILVLIGSKVRTALRKQKQDSSSLRGDLKPSFRSVQKMKDILKMIDERLGDTYVCKFDKEGNIIGHDNDKLFDAIDVDGSGVISYEELDKAMALTGDQLSMFIRQMNRKAGNEDNDKFISRECFVKYFFETIQAASNFDPTVEDAKQVFDSIPRNNRGSIVGGDMVALESLYTSSLSTFLSEKQILTLVRLFEARLKTMERNVLHSNEEIEVVAGNAQNDDGSLEQDVPLQRSTEDTGSHSVRKRFSSMVTELHRYITKEEFLNLYPALLHEMTGKREEKRHPFDIHFENLSLVVGSKGNEKVVVNKVSGRIRAGTMTALMGGSGAGKTSLLNALCGRAYYGKTSGTININGKETNIDTCKDSTGFVPQDDIVYAELTVKENLMFAGKLRLPRGTPVSEIEDLADDVIADLGLTRVSSSIVGDVTKRGISGGEKKRVNIGLELMSKPSILFLDEPTSGLDSSSAMTVMGSLSNLVRNQGMTVCTVIHQPRKQIYDICDALILLGIGGNMVYHGPSSSAKDYFISLGYELEEGEAIADWMIDISSGELGPSLMTMDGNTGSDEAGIDSDDSDISYDEEQIEAGLQPLINVNMDGSLKEEANRERLYTAWRRHFDNLGESEKQFYDKPLPTQSVVSGERIVANVFKDTITTKVGITLVTDENKKVIVDKLTGLSAATELQVGDQVIKVNDTTIVGTDCSHAIDTIKSLSGNITVVAFRSSNTERRLPSFFNQVSNQFKRCALLFTRNIHAKILEILIIVAGTIIITLIEKPLRLNEDINPQIPSEYYVLTSVGEEPGLFDVSLNYIFRHSIENANKVIGFGMKISTIIGVLVTLSSAKVITDKRIEFYREAASGYDISAYLLAVILFNTLEITVKMTISSLFAYALRNTATNPGNFVLQFILLGWTSSAWGFVFALIVPAQSVTLVCAFFAIFTNLLLSGANGAAILYTDIYRKGGIFSLIPGLFAPNRYFVEAMAVNEFRSLSVQHGFTEFTLLDDGYEMNDGTYVDGTEKFLSVGFNSTSLAMNDPYVFEESRSGWFNNVIPCFLVGLTVRLLAFILLQLMNRKKMLKKPIMRSKGKCKLFLLFVVFASSLGAAIFFFTNSYDLCEVDDKTRLGDGTCDLEGNYNTKFCRYDSSCDIYNGKKYCRNDCLAHNRKQDMIKKYPECECPNCEEEGEDIYERMGNGWCEKYLDIFESLNTTECGWDGGDCVELNKRKKENMINYPNCSTVPSFDDGDWERLGDGYCSSWYNNEECGWDGGDCLVEGYPKCFGVYPQYIGNGICSGGEYNTIECGWDGGDCIEFNAKYPNCTVSYPNWIGNGSCEGGEYNTVECGWDGGDCDEVNERKKEMMIKYPNCSTDDWVYKRLGDGTCYKNYNNEECGWDGGDCIEFNAKYPNCTVTFPYLIGDGSCEDSYNNEECGWDGGDCVDFNQKKNQYPDCVSLDSWNYDNLGDGYCHSWYNFNNEECGWDDGDCL